MASEQGSGLPPAKIDFPIWKTIEAGGVPGTDYLARLRAGKYLVGPWGRGMLNQEGFGTLAAPRRFDLIKVQVRDLGFRTEPWTRQIFARIQELGYQLCPVDVGPQLRIDLPEQPFGEYFWLAMPLIEDHGGRLFFIGVSDDGTRWLRGYEAKPDFKWVLDAKFVFAKARE